MINFIRSWFQRQFSDPQVVVLTLLLIFVTVMTLVMAKMVAPVLAAVVIAYLLEGTLAKLRRLGMPRSLALGIVFLLFVLILLFVVLVVIPRLTRQIASFVRDLPIYLSEGQRILERLPEHYPSLISEAQVQSVFDTLRSRAGDLGGEALAQSLGFLPDIITMAVYLILLPLLVFFMLKDKDDLLAWVMSYLPDDSRLASGVWNEVDRQLGNYVRGKFWELFIVGMVSWVTFTALGLNYSVLLGALVGLSVLVPYVGATVVTFPVFFVAFTQWGWSNEFLTLAAAYGIIQALDANVLVPLLFSEAVDLHPIAIIVAVLFFGNLWGFWGVFFAIPLATVVKAVLSAWPRRPHHVAVPTQTQRAE